MIFLHLILGLILGKFTGQYWLFIIASVFPDIDHFYNIIKHKFYLPSRLKLLIDSEEHEARYHIRYKTPLLHSLMGLIIFSLLFYIIFNNYLLTGYFSLAYLLHLLMDWPDKDVKFYLYPFRIKFNGFLPIWSKTERVLTIVAVIIFILLFI
jgi:hypothetical protein